jgi:hypothetical protein
VSRRSSLIHQQESVRVSKRIPNALIAAVAVATATVVVTAQQSPPPQSRGQSPIRLKATTFTPTRGEEPNIPPGLTIAGYGANQRGYYLVQFEGPVVESWKTDLAAIGVDILDYVPDFAFKVRMTPHRRQSLQPARRFRNATNRCSK